jgi:hypothetical protein
MSDTEDLLDAIGRDIESTGGEWWIGTATSAPALAAYLRGRGFTDSMWDADSEALER